MALLQRLQGVLIDLDGALQLLYVLCAALAKCSLGLPVPLLALFGSGIYLAGRQQLAFSRKWLGQRLNAPASGRPCASVSAEGPARRPQRPAQG